MLTASQYNQIFTMHGTTMVFLLGMPLSVAFANYMIPLMIGARDVAFPRLNAFGYWVFVLGGMFLYSSFLLGGAPNGGWFGYTPLTSTPLGLGALPGRGTDFWIVGIVMLGIASTTSAINIIVTILNMRAPGMSLMRMPVFVWMMLVTFFLTLFAMPIITVAMIMVFFDRNFGTSFFLAAKGGDPLLYQNLFWLFGHPEVYILILPGDGHRLGGAARLLAQAPVRLPRRGVLRHRHRVPRLGRLGAPHVRHRARAGRRGGVQPLDDAHRHPDRGEDLQLARDGVEGRDRSSPPPMLFSLGFIAMFTIGGLSGVSLAVVPADTQQHDTYFVVAHFHYVLFGGSVFGLFAGFYYWYPKIFGRMLDERLGKISFWTMLIGFNVTFFPMHLLGIFGMPRRIYTYNNGLGWNTLNLIITVGAFVIALSVLIFIVNLIVSHQRGKIAGNDPWDGRTIEWSISSPPPEYNFAEIPEIDARDDFWHRKYTEDDAGMLVPLPSGGSDTPAATRAAASPGHRIHMPSPSFFPFIAALALPILGYAAVFHSFGWSFALLAVGVLVLVFGVYAWAIEPATAPEEAH